MIKAGQEPMSGTQAHADWHPPTIQNKKGATPPVTPAVPAGTDEGLSDQEWSRREKEKAGTIGSTFSPPRRLVPVGAGGAGKTGEKPGPRQTEEHGSTGRKLPSRIQP